MSAEDEEATFRPHLNENTRRLCEMMAEEGFAVALVPSSSDRRSTR